jgi:hypothetical protein
VSIEAAQFNPHADGRKSSPTYADGG